MNSIYAIKEHQIITMYWHLNEEYKMQNDCQLNFHNIITISIYTVSYYVAQISTHII